MVSQYVFSLLVETHHLPLPVVTTYTVAIAASQVRRWTSV
jgi:hypothetical protein